MRAQFGVFLLTVVGGGAISAVAFYVNMRTCESLPRLRVVLPVPSLVAEVRDHPRKPPWHPAASDCAICRGAQVNSIVLVSRRYCGCACGAHDDSCAELTVTSLLREAAGPRSAVRAAAGVRLQRAGVVPRCCPLPLSRDGGARGQRANAILVVRRGQVAFRTRSRRGIGSQVPLNHSCAAVDLNACIRLSVSRIRGRALCALRRRALRCIVISDT